MYKSRSEQGGRLPVPVTVTVSGERAFQQVDRHRVSDVLSGGPVTANGALGDVGLAR